jgi:predicted DNA-binding transcriptional regulator AlpA
MIATDDGLELLTLRDVCALAQISISTGRVWRRLGKLPPALCITRRGLRWRRQTIRTWLDRLEAGAEWSGSIQDVKG